MKHVWKRRCPDVYEVEGNKAARAWICGKCGLKRSNRETHTHGIPMKDGR